MPYRATRRTLHSIAAQAGGGAAPTFVGATSAGGYSTSVTCAVPGDVIDGDIMIAAFDVYVSGRTVTQPDGWDVVLTEALITVYSRVASSEPANYTWLRDGAANNIAALITAYRGSSGVDASSSATVVSSIITAPSIITTANNCVLLWAKMHESQIPTYPDGFTKVNSYKGASANVHYIGADVAENAGATGDITGTITYSGTAYCWLVALKP